MSLPDAFPLQWPEGWPRTKYPRESRYKLSQEGRVRDELLDSIRKLGGSVPIISSNIELRLDGLPYANRRVPEDAGVAVYWVREGKQEVMACDRWKRPWENMRAIYHAVEGMRAMERAGATQILERAFQAFALPSGEQTRPWRDVFHRASSECRVTFGPLDSVENVKKAFRALVISLHPDKGGDVEKFRQLEKAFRDGLEELKW